MESQEGARVEGKQLTAAASNGAPAPGGILNLLRRPPHLEDRESQERLNDRRAAEAARLDGAELGEGYYIGKRENYGGVNVKGEAGEVKDEEGEISSVVHRSVSKS